ncbi:MAG: TlpA family protein disulfide reductase [Saprospiraceae bacterium]|nr:TlpA family protein disulfide reductase [Saprospiraceae bacterium]
MLRLLLLLLLVSPFASTAQDIVFVKADEIARWKAPAGDTVRVINFWATWCQPCVAELPAFEKITAEYAGRPVQVILVCTDFKRDVDTRVRPFVQKKKLRSQVVFMDESNPNKWIDSVSPEWSGAIPATLIVCPAKGVERFFEQQLDYETLRKEVEAALR